MKALSKIFGKFKKKKDSPLTTDPIISHPELELATLTSIMMVDAMPSVLTGSADGNTQVIQAACIAVSVQLGPIIITQTSSLIRLPNLESPLRFPLRRSTIWNMIPPSVTYSYVSWLLLIISSLGISNPFPLTLRQAIKLLNLLALL